PGGDTGSAHPVTIAVELLQLMAQYRAGLEAEMVLLNRLERLADRQRSASQDGDLPLLNGITDDRDRMMANLVRIEYELKPVRLSLLDRREEIGELSEFKELISLHRDAAALVTQIVGYDRD